MARIHDLGWWYWFVTVGLLGAGLFVGRRGSTGRSYCAPFRSVM